MRICESVCAKTLRMEVRCVSLDGRDSVPGVPEPFARPPGPGRTESPAPTPLLCLLQAAALARDTEHLSWQSLCPSEMSYFLGLLVLHPSSLSDPTPSNWLTLYLWNLDSKLCAPRLPLCFHYLLLLYKLPRDGVTEILLITARESVGRNSIGQGGAGPALSPVLSAGIGTAPVASSSSAALAGRLRAWAQWDAVPLFEVFA